jgi:P-type E1-E2 ATPase
VIEVSIPGRGTLKLEHLVLDVNGTLALDGTLIEGVAQALARLGGRLEIHLITADTHGKQAGIDRLLGLTAERLQAGGKVLESEQKAAFVRWLGAEGVAAIGQGANDAGMLKEAGLGIATLSREGLAVAALNAADLVMPDILSALELFDKPMRIVASLRS